DRDRAACAGPVLRHRARGDVHVEVAVFERLANDADLRRVRARIRERGAAAFLHHVAEVAGQHEVTVARHDARLDVHDVAARGRVEHSGRDARRFELERTLASRARTPAQRAHFFGAARVEARGPPYDGRRGRLAGDGADGRLSLAKARLVRVAADHLADRGALDGDVVLVEPALAKLSGNEVLPRDREL